MYYAINRYTKEHRVISGSAQAMAFGVRDDWRVVEADADGWIKHDGSDECPLPSSSWCEVYRNPGKARFSEAWRFNWRDIEMYRPIINDKEQDMSEQEWDGEGLPPVGTECEYLDGVSCQWGPAAIVAHHINGEEAIWSRYIHGGELFYGTASDFRPIRTAAQRAEDAIKQALAEAVQELRDVLDDDVCARVVVEAIREGRIPGVKLEDDA